MGKKGSPVKEHVLFGSQLAQGIAAVIFILASLGAFFGIRSCGASRTSQDNTQLGTAMNKEGQNGAPNASANSQPPAAAQATKYKGSPLPSEIHKKVMAAVPYQRDSVGSSYVGVLVEWTMSFSSVDKDGRVALYPENGGSPGVFFTVDIKKNPILKSLPADSKLTVRGRIAGVEAFRIMLADVTIIRP